MLENIDMLKLAFSQNIGKQIIKSLNLFFAQCVVSRHPAEHCMKSAIVVIG